MRLTTVQIYSNKCKNDVEECRCESKAKLSPPWYEYQRKVQNLFQADPELKVSDLEKKSETEYSFMIESQNKSKLEAIKKLIGDGVQLGNIHVTIEYKCDDESADSWAKIVETAFQGNSYFKEVVVESDPVMGTAFYYGVFSRDIISFWNDNLADYSGNEHYIPAELVNDIVSAHTNISFCTENVKE